jgi:hypothetical protein
MARTLNSTLWVGQPSDIVLDNLNAGWTCHPDLRNLQLASQIDPMVSCARSRLLGMGQGCAGVARVPRVSHPLGSSNRDSCVPSLAIFGQLERKMMLSTQPRVTSCWQKRPLAERAQLRGN